MATTPNYNYDIPDIGADDSIWGDRLNSNWSDIDTDLKTISDAQSNYLPLAGGAMTGSLVLNADPTADLEASTKAYVDTLRTDAASTYLPLAGGVITGPTTINYPDASLTFEETDQIADLKKWLFVAFNGDFSLQARADNDAVLDGLFVAKRNTNGITDYLLSVVGDSTTIPDIDSAITKRRLDQYLPDNTYLKSQAGQLISAPAAGSVTFPTPFSSSNVSVNATAIQAPGDEIVMTVNNITASGFSYERRSGSGNARSGDFCWQAMEY